MAFYRVTAAGLNVRTSPSSDTNDNLFPPALPINTVVEKIGESDDKRWAKIRITDGANIREGWVAARFLALTDAPTPIHDDGDQPVPAWIVIAEREVGVRETEPDNPRIQEYLSTATNLSRGQMMQDETDWCSAFVNWCLTQAGYTGTNHALARSWMNWTGGDKITQPLIDCQRANLSQGRCLEHQDPQDPLLAVRWVLFTLGVGDQAPIGRQSGREVASAAGVRRCDGLSRGLADEVTNLDLTVCAQSHIPKPGVVDRDDAVLCGGAQQRAVGRTGDDPFPHTELREPDEAIVGRKLERKGVIGRDRTVLQADCRNALQFIIVRPRAGGRNIDDHITGMEVRPVERRRRAGPPRREPQPDIFGLAGWRPGAALETEFLESEGHQLT